MDIAVRMQARRAIEMAQLAQCLAFELADALARKTILLADLLECVVRAGVHAVPHPYDLRFPWRQRCQGFVQVSPERHLHRRRFR